MQYTENLKKKKKKKLGKKLDEFLNILAPNIDYRLDQPQQGCCDENPQCMFCIKNEKNRYTPVSQSLIV